jgi:alpha 1,3-glucosidase
MLLRLSALLLIAPAHALKEHDFRKCGDTPFCKLHRSPPSHGGFEVDVPSVAHADNVLTARLRCAEAKECLLPLRLAVSVLASGAVRAQIEEDSSVSLDDLDAPDPAVPKPAQWDDDMDGEWVAPRVTLGRAVKARFRPEHSFASTAAVALQQCSHVGGQSTQLLRCASGIEVEVRHAPLSVAVKVGGQAVAELNGRGLLRFEHYRQQRASEMAEAPPPPEQHTFGSFTDPLPFGSSSVGLDVSFPRATRARMRIEPHRRRAAPADRLPRRAQTRTGCPSARWRTRCRRRWARSRTACSTSTSSSTCSTTR